MRQNQNVQKQDDSAVVQSISIATPCHVDWESMSGDERKRFCGQCKLNVYNVSTMSTREAADFIRHSEGRACVSLYRRADGTIITDNCPVGMRKLRDRAMAKSAAVAALFTLLGVAGVSQAHGQNLGAIAPGNFCERPASAALTPWLVRASIVSSLGLAVLYMRKKARPLTIGLLLLAIWISFGFIAGITSGFSF